MPVFATRSQADELIDDLGVDDAGLTWALENIRWVNRWLGGYAATMSVLGPWLARQQGRPVRVLDLGTGRADFPEYLVRWADRRGLPLEVVGVDLNPATVDYARRTLDHRLPAHLRARVQVETGDVFALPFEDQAFDVVTAALFMHHLETDEAAALLRTMHRLGRHGLVVNDLHRHPLAYYGIWALAHLLPTSPVFRHDAPLSVLRSFRRDELHALARAASLPRYTIRWHWAFRWTVSTLG